MKFRIKNNIMTCCFNFFLKPAFLILKSGCDCKSAVEQHLPVLSRVYLLFFAEHFNINFVPLVQIFGYNSRSIKICFWPSGCPCNSNIRLFLSKIMDYGKLFWKFHPSRIFGCVPPGNKFILDANKASGAKEK